MMSVQVQCRGRMPSRASGTAVIVPARQLNRKSFCMVSIVQETCVQANALTRTGCRPCAEVELRDGRCNDVYCRELAETTKSVPYPAPLKSAAQAQCGN
ncbi:hypothetical protein MRB53_039233 [Persea americana]|nr:hypothetical protein MRB53_039233 [Persea americana]